MGGWDDCLGTGSKCCRFVVELLCLLRESRLWRAKLRKETAIICLHLESSRLAGFFNRKNERLYRFLGNWLCWGDLVNDE